MEEIFMTFLFFCNLDSLESVLIISPIESHERSIFQIPGGRKPRNSFHPSTLKFGVCLFVCLKSKLFLCISYTFLSKSITAVITDRKCLLENKHLPLTKASITESLMEDLTELHSLIMCLTWVKSRENSKMFSSIILKYELWWDILDFLMDVLIFVIKNNSLNSVTFFLQNWSFVLCHKTILLSSQHPR